MGKHNVNIGLLQSFQTALETFDHMLPRQASSIWLFAASTEEDLKQM
jgi:hypothetical protein